MLDALSKKWPIEDKTKLQLFSLATPNGVKASIALEELGLPYEAHTVNIMEGDQFLDAFVAINPNSKIPALVDPNGPNGEEFAVMESGAILLYLAEKGGGLLPKDPALRSETIQWLFFQVGSVGPMFGQFGHFFRYAKDRCDHPYPVERYQNETKRLLGVLNRRLEGRTFLVAEEFTVADISIFPWVRGLVEFYEASEVLEIASFPHVTAWLARCLERPAVQRGLQVAPFS